MRRVNDWTSVAGPLLVGSLMVTTVGASSIGGQECEGPQVHAVLEFASGAAEGLAMSRRGDIIAGNIYTGEVWLAPRGDFGAATVVADLIDVESPLRFLLGIDVTSDGTIYAALNAFLDPAKHGLWRIEGDGTVTRVAAFPPFFQSLINDVAIDPRGHVYVSDSLGGAVWRLAPDGELSKWSDSNLWDGGIHPLFGIPFGVNGLAYHQGALYGAIYLEGRIVRVPLRHDGRAGEPETIVADPALVGADGIELDAAGNIYVTVNDANRIVQIDHRDSRIAALASAGLSAPASLALSPNRQAIYVANLSRSAPVPRPYAPAVVRLTSCEGR